MTRNPLRITYLLILSPPTWSPQANDAREICDPFGPNKVPVLRTNIVLGQTRSKYAAGFLPGDKLSLLYE